MLLFAACAPETAPEPDTYALRFTGGDECVEVPYFDTPVPEEGTIEGWVTLEDANADGVVFEWAGAFGLRFLDGELVFQFGDGQVSAPLTGEPTHLAGSWGGGTLTLAVDGTRVGTSEANEPDGVDVGMRIGCGLETPAWRGVIDEVRLSSTQRSADVSATSAPWEADSDTVSLFHLDEGAGHSAFDAADTAIGQVWGPEWIVHDLE